MIPSIDPDPDTEPQPDPISGIDADESDNQEVITNAARVRDATDKYYEKDDDGS